MTESKEPDSDEPDAPTGSASGAKAKEDAVWSAIQEAWAAARNHSSEIGRLAADHVSVQADRVRLRIRRAAIRAAIALLLAMTLVVALAAAAVHAISGLTGGLGALFGVGWLGQLVGGILVLGVVAAAIAAALRVQARRHLRRAVDKHGALRADGDATTPPTPETVRDESAYLKERAARTRSGLVDASRALGEDVVSMLDARRVVKAHPWWSVGASAGTGFVFGRGFIRRSHKLPRSIAAMLFAMPVRRLAGLILRALSRRATEPRPDTEAASTHADNGGDRGP